MDDFNIDFKNTKDSKVEKRNNLCHPFNLTNLVEGHTCFTNVHKSSID